MVTGRQKVLYVFEMSAYDTGEFCFCIFFSILDVYFQQLHLAYIHYLFGTRERLIYITITIFINNTKPKLVKL